MRDIGEVLKIKDKELGVKWMVHASDDCEWLSPIHSPATCDPTRPTFFSHTKLEELIASSFGSVPRRVGLGVSGSSNHDHDLKFKLLWR